jgi:cell volume regulation protein A
MAYVLTIGFLTLVINQDQSFASIIPMFLQQMILGGALGFGFGVLSKLVINKIKLDFEGLYPVLAIALMFITFSATDFVGGNGFLAIYICAVYLGNQDLIHKKTILKMFDGLAWLVEIVLFLTLGLLVFPSQMVPYFGVGLLISLFLIFIARPVGVLLSLMFFKMKFKRRLYISWVGLRGAVPIVFATYPLLAGVGKANVIFNIVFFISVTSVLLQGTTLSLMAKWLNVALPQEQKKLTATDLLLSESSKAEMKEILITSQCFAVDKKVVELGFPKNAIIAMIIRDNKYLTPNGATKIEAEDTLVVLADRPTVFDEVYEVLKIPNQSRA